MGELLLGTDYIGPTSGSLFCVTFEITASPAQGQSLTSLIDPSYGVVSKNTAFVNTSYVEETPLSTAPCAYTYRDSAAWSPNPTFISCSPNTVRANSPATCTAVVSGFNVTGTITWSSNSSTGSFSPSICTLSYGNCATTYTDSSPGTVTITASYSGDPDNTPSNGSTILEVTQTEASWTYAYCSANSVYSNSPVTCNAGVFGFNPTGTITWSSNSSTGSFSPSICTLSSGFCSTTYTDCNPGTVAITASYSGDPDNTPSSASTTLTVIPEPVLPQQVSLSVPYHHQVNGYYCGPAALEEVFNFYGPDVSQLQIGDIARTTSDGTYSNDLIRAAQFSNLSSSSESQAREPSPFAGYSARSLGYAACFVTV